MSRWRAASRKVILAALKAGRAAGLDGKALEEHVSAAYPFGERAMHPYKIWLNEFALLVRGERKAMNTGKRSGPKLAGSWPMTDRQRDLFGGDGA